MNHISNLEKVFEDYEKHDQSILIDPQIQIFILLSNNPSQSFTLEQITEGIKPNLKGLVNISKGKIRQSFSILYRLELVTFDFITRTYKYNPSTNSERLLHHINKIRQL